MIREQDQVFDRRLRELEAAKHELTERMAALEAKVEGAKPSEESFDSDPLVEHAIREIMHVYHHGTIFCERTAREAAMRILAPLVEALRQAEYTARHNAGIAAVLRNERDKLRRGRAGELERRKEEEGRRG